MYKELKLNVGTRYSVITLVFFTTYIVFQFPSTIIIKKLGPRNHLTAITLLWGICMIGMLMFLAEVRVSWLTFTGMGFVKDWKSLAALRTVLGILEAGFFPGAVYLLR
jgi:MFS family permease